MTISRTAWIDDDGSGTTGTIINNAAKTSLYNEIDGAVGTPWTGPEFLAGNFSANNGATWAVTNASIYWAFNPSLKVMHVFVTVTASTVTGAPTNLIVSIPANRSAATTALGSSFISHPAAPYEVGVVLSIGTQLILHRPAVGTFGAGAVNGYFSISVPLT